MVAADISFVIFKSVSAPFNSCRVDIGDVDNAAADVAADVAVDAAADAAANFTATADTDDASTFGAIEVFRARGGASSAAEELAEAEAEAAAQ